MYTVIRDFPRPPSHVVEALVRFPAAVITGSMGRYGAVRSEIKGIYQGIRVAGPTSRYRPLGPVDLERTLEDKGVRWPDWPAPPGAVTA